MCLECRTNSRSKSLIFSRISYPYGLRIATLSSKKLGDSYEGQLKNNYLYQGGYSELDDDIGWNDFALRNYDAQIGRWVQQDPYQEFASPYVGMGADPVNLTDPSGGITVTGTMIQVVGRVTEGLSWFSKAGIVVQTLNAAINLLSIEISTKPIGDGPSLGTPRMRRANRWARSEFGETAKIRYGKDGQLRLSYADEEAADVTFVDQLLEDGEDFLKQFSTWNRAKRIGNFVLDVLPGIGDAKGLLEAGFGSNILGDKLSGGDRLLNGTPVLSKLKKLGKITKLKKVLNASAEIQRYTKSSLKLGRQMHDAYHAGKVGKEFRLPSGRRIDYLDIENGIIYELKPNNPRAIRRGEGQLNDYLKELQSPETLLKHPEFRGIKWKTVLDKYYQ